MLFSSILTLVPNIVDQFEYQFTGLYVLTHSTSLDSFEVSLSVISFINYVVFCGLLMLYVSNKDFITLLISMELIAIGSFMYVVIFSNILGSCAGHIYSLFLLTLMVVEAAVSLSLIIKFFTVKKSIYIEAATDVF